MRDADGVSCSHRRKVSLPFTANSRNTANAHPPSQEIVLPLDDCRNYRNSLPIKPQTPPHISPSIHRPPSHSTKVPHCKLNPSLPQLPNSNAYANSSLRHPKVPSNNRNLHPTASLNSPSITQPSLHSRQGS